MSVLSLDPEAIQLAQTLLQGVAGQIGQESARHSRVAWQVRQALAEMARALLDSLNPLDQLDPWGPWNNWGLSRLRDECRASHDIVSNARASARGIVRQLREQHGDVVGGPIAARASEYDDVLGDALQMLWGVLDVFDPSNLIRYMYDPGALVDNIERVGNMLSDAVGRVNDYIAYLDRVRQREESVIGSIVLGAISGVSAASDALRNFWIQHSQTIVEVTGEADHIISTLDDTLQELGKLITHDAAEQMSQVAEDLKSMSREIEDVAGQLRDMKELPPEMESVLKDLAENAKVLRGEGEEIAKAGKALGEVPVIGKIADAVTVIADIADLAAGKKDPHTVISKIGGDLLGFEPHVAIVQAVAFVLSLPGDALSWGMQQEANRASGPYKQEFEQLRSLWKQNADGFGVVNGSDTGNLPQDLVALWLDTGGTGVPIPISILGFGGVSQTLSDAGKVTGDIGSVLWSTVDFFPLLVASNAAQSSMYLSQADQWIQTLPGPSWVKGDLGWATNTGSQALNDVANTIIGANNLVNSAASSVASAASSVANDITSWF